MHMINYELTQYIGKGGSELIDIDYRGTLHKENCLNARQLTPASYLQCQCFNLARNICPCFLRHSHMHTHTHTHRHTHAHAGRKNTSSQSHVCFPPAGSISARGEKIYKKACLPSCLPPSSCCQARMAQMKRILIYSIAPRLEKRLAPRQPPRESFSRIFPRSFLLIFKPES